MLVGSEAGDQEICSILGVGQVTEMSRMHDIEHAMTHDHGLLSGTRPDRARQLFERLDLLPIVGLHRARWWNHASVAAAIVSGVQRGAARQSSMRAIMARTPSSNDTLGSHPR